MNLIPLTQGKFAQVDDSDYDFLMQWKWYAHKSGNNLYYATRSVHIGKKVNKEFMHRKIMGINCGAKIDHRDGDRLNNQRANIRNCTHSENSKNRSPSKGSSCKYLGVCIRRDGSIVANIRINGKNKYLGVFKTPEEAAKKYDELAKQHHGEFANLNFK